MAWVVGTGGFLGLLAISWGIVTLRTGWILPTARRHVTRPKLHGLGAVLTGASTLLQSLQVGAARLTRPFFVKEEWLDSQYFRDHLPLEGASG